MSNKPVANKKQNDDRAHKLKIYSIGSIVLLIGIVLVTNILFDGIFGKILTFDFSDYGQNSISEESETFIDSLSPDTHVRIIGLFNRPDNVSGTPYQYIIPLLDDYEKKSDGKITVEYYDLTENPTIINQLDPSNSYDLASNADNFVVEYNGRIKIITPLDCYTYDQERYYYTGVYYITSNNTEYVFTNTINMLTSNNVCKAYIVSGLKEESSFYITQIMNSMSINVEELPSSDNFVIPDDCDLLILNGPNADISEKMYVAMTDYVKNGGKIFIAVDFNMKNVSERFDRLNLLVNQMGINIDPAMINENDPGYQRSGYTIDHTVTSTDPFADYSTLPYFHATYSRSISGYKNPSTSVDVIPVLTTSNNASLTEFDTNGNAIESSTDTTGQYYVAMYSSGQSADSAQMFVFGTANFSSDEYISGYGMNDVNVEFFKSCIRKLTGSKSASSINVEVKNVDNFALDNTKATTSSATMIMVIFMIVIPVVLVGLAVVVYTKRKNL